MNYDLFFGKTLRISSRILAQDNTTAVSANLDVVVPPIAARKSYCGPCQLKDRSLCIQLNKICWIDYQNFTITTPIIYSDCLKAIAPICFNIWNTTGFNDPQCIDFVSHFNLTQMKSKPALVSASYSPSGKSLFLKFNTSIQAPVNAECSYAFDSITLKWLRNSRTCRKIESDTIEINYDPQVGIMEYLTINGNSFFYDYPYSPIAVDSTTIKIDTIPLGTEIIINGLNSYSECDSIDVFAITTKPVIYPLAFKWNIEYTENLQSSFKESFDNYFSQFTSDFSKNSALTIPYQFLKKGNSLKITAYAKSANTNSNILSATKEIKILGNVPKVKLMAKSKSFIQLEGNKRTNLPLQIDNVKCEFRLDSAEQSTFIPIEITFQVKSGNNFTAIDTHLEQEKLIENNISEIYQKHKALIVGNNNGFKYNIFYKITAIINDRETQLSSTDSIILQFVKPEVKSVIESSGSLVSTKTDIILSGKNSLIPERENDEVNYQWKCMKAESLSLGVICNCPILSQAESRFSEIKLSKEKITSKCKYKFSLTISAISQQTGVIRTAYNETEFYTYDGPAIPVNAKVVEGNSIGVKDAYLTVTLPDIDNSENVKYKWSLLEMESLDPRITANFSQKGEFIYDFLTNNLNVAANPDIKNTESNSTNSNLQIFQGSSSCNLTSLYSHALGIDRSKMLPDYKYTFSVVITKDKINTFLLVPINTSPRPKPRIFAVNPSEGIGFNTAFTFTFITESSNDPDTAYYQLFRKDCTNENRLNIISEKFSHSNSHIMPLAPGSASCGFKVEISLRVFEYGSFADFKANVTVREPNIPLETIVGFQLSQIRSNPYLSIAQKISLISELARINVTNSIEVANSQYHILVEQISQFDTPDGILSTLDNETQTEFLVTSTEIISNLIENQQTILDAEQAANVKNKVESYLVKVQTKQGGIYIIPSVLSALSNISNIDTVKQDDTAFFASMQNAMNLMSEMKLEEMIPGSLPYSINSPSISMLIDKSFSSIYEQQRQFKTENNVSISLPYGTEKNLLQSLNNTENKIIAIGASVYTTTFNPFKNIKSNTNISTSTNLTNSVSGLNNATVAKIYEDFRKGIYTNSPSMKERESPIVQLSFKPFIIKNDASEEPISSSLGIGEFAESQYLQFDIPLVSNLSQIMNESLILPLYYDNDNEIWTNENCTLQPINSTKQIITARCSHAGKKGIKNLRDTFALTVDIIKDVYKIINQGNYQQLLEVSALLAINQRNIIAYSIVGATFLMVICTIVLLSKMDNHDLYTARVQCLAKYFGKEKKIIQTGTLYQVMKFFSKLKKNGSLKASKGLQTSIKSSSDTDFRKETEQKIIVSTSKKNPFKKANGFSVLSSSEKTELWDLYQLYLQCTRIYDSQEEIEEVLSQELKQSILINRMTQYYIDDIVLIEPVTFWVLFKNEHPLLNAVMKSEITTPRPLKILIFFCTLVGEFFVTGYLNDSSQTGTALETETSEFISKSIIYSLAATALMIPLKIFISLFMTGAMITRIMSKEQISSSESYRPIFQTIGTIFGFAWLLGCLYGIMMYVIQFTPECIDGWALTFGMSVFFEIIWMAQLKVFVKVIIGMLLMRILRTRIMLSAAGVIASVTVDWIVRIL